MTRSINPIVSPANDLRQDGHWWISTGDDPFFLLEFGPGGPPQGWVLIDIRVEAESGTLAPTLYLDTGAGFSAELTRALPPSTTAGNPVLVNFPPGTRTVRLDPMSGPGRMRLKALAFEPVSRIGALRRRVTPLVRRVLAHPELLVPYAKEASRIFRQEGPRALLRHALHSRGTADAAMDYAAWVEAYDTLSAQDRASIARKMEHFGYRPRISILVPLYNTPEEFLRRCIDSVVDQIYPEWELCLVNDASPMPHVRAVCEKYAKSDPRIRYVHRETNGHISAASNSALEIASGDFCALLDHDDELAPHALYMVAQALNDQPNLDLIFSDEDKIDEQGRRFEPWFKSSWNYDLMLSQNAVVHLAVFRSSILRQIGGFRSGFDGSQDYDMTLRFAEKTSAERIRHLPFILYHWRAIRGSVALATTEKLYPYDAARLAISEHLERTGRPATAARQDHLGYYRVTWQVPEPAPRVSIIIPTKDKVDLLRVAVESILEKTAYQHFEIVVVNNRSVEAQTLGYFEEIAKLPRVRVIDYDKPYSFAALNNWAVTQTDAPLLGFLNNDIEVLEPDWLGEMVGHALRPEVGSVGAKLFYPNSTIQHAGIVVGIGGLAGHPHVGQPRESFGYYGRAACAQRYSAVTAACLIMRREVFMQVQGFDEVNFAVAFNDVDLGLRLGRLGYANVWTPHARLVHHESASLGLPTNEDRRNQFLNECDNFRRLWPEAIADDPFYNPNLTITGGDFQPGFPPRVKKPWLSE